MRYNLRTMAVNTEKIGALISASRKQRGMTQAEFAKQLKTSQSAVNRIESGKQNLSMEMLGRISEVLDKEIVSISSGQINFKVEGGRELKGTIETKVSKNAAVGLLAASLLNKGTTVLERIPRIEEVSRLIEVLTSIGVSVRWMENNDLEIKPPAKLKIAEMNVAAAKQTRSVLMFLGPLMHLSNDFNIPYAGGCNLGTRSVKPHLYALEEFGVSIKAARGRYETTVKKKAPGQVVLFEPGDTVTENAIMAAAKTKGVTKLRFVTANYMVQDLCFFLQKLGVRIDGIGTTNLAIHGVDEINKRVRYAPAEDPIETMAFLSIAATTNSSIKITRCPIDFLEVELMRMEKMGFKYTRSEVYKARNGKSNLVDIKTQKTESLHALTEKITALPYPGLNMDNLPFFVPIAARAKGRTMIHDWSYENRAIYYTELNKLNAQVELLDPHRVYVNGPTKWRPAEIVCPPALRPAVIILIGMLAAEGTSILRNVYSINRGYEDLAQRLNSLGAKITILREI